MYWYKPLNKITIYLIASFVLLLAINSCKSDSHSATDTNKFFDIKGYFKADSARLSKLNPLVDKTVVHNGITETQKVHVPNWGTELSLFSESDINKPAWKASYNVQTTDDFLIYKAKDPSLKTHETFGFLVFWGIFIPSFTSFTFSPSKFTSFAFDF